MCVLLVLSVTKILAERIEINIGTHNDRSCNLVDRCVFAEALLCAFCRATQGNYSAFREEACVVQMRCSGTITELDMILHGAHGAAER